MQLSSSSHSFQLRLPSCPIDAAIEFCYLVVILIFLIDNGRACEGSIAGGRQRASGHNHPHFG